MTWDAWEYCAEFPGQRERTASVVCCCLYQIRLFCMPKKHTFSCEILINGLETNDAACWHSIGRGFRVDGVNTRALKTSLYS